MISGFLDEELTQAEGSAQEIFIQRSFAMWTAVDYNDNPASLNEFIHKRLDEHNEWESIMLSLSVLIWCGIILVLILIPYYIALEMYCTNIQGLKEVDAACQHAFWQHIEIDLGYPKGGFFYDWSKDIQLDYD